MGLGGILILLLLLVSLIVFIYVLVVTARGWGWLHSILLSLLFIECWVMIAFSAGVQYRRVSSTQQAHKNRESAETAEAQTQQLLWGGFDTETLEAVVPVQGKLRRLTADRGRVWRQLNFLQAADSAYQLELSVADGGAAGEAAADDVLGVEPAAAAAAAPALSSESLPVNTVVYAFAEQINEAEQAIPAFYLGEFVVKQSQAGQVTLAPTLELYPEQQQRIAAGGAASWTLYELLPLDSHDIYTAADSQPSEEAAFGSMDEETIRGTFANASGDGKRQEQLISSYLRDGQQADENTPLEDVWIQVNVLKETDFDVDSEEVADATERGYFDSSGRSIDTRLKRGDDGVVKRTPDMKGKTIVLREEIATPLINSGNLELVRRIYIRPLIDYEEAFVHHMVRDHEVGQAIDLAKRDSAEVQKANQLGQEMISFRQTEEQELKSDLANYQREVKILEQAVAEAAGDLASLRTTIQQLYQSIQSRHEAMTGTGLGTVSLGN